MRKWLKSFREERLKGSKLRKKYLSRFRTRKLFSWKMRRLTILLRVGKWRFFNASNWVRIIFLTSLLSRRWRATRLKKNWRSRWFSMSLISTQEGDNHYEATKTWQKNLKKGDECFSLYFPTFLKIHESFFESTWFLFECILLSIKFELKIIICFFSR